MVISKCIFQLQVMWRRTKWKNDNELLIGEDLEEDSDYLFQYIFVDLTWRYRGKSLSRR
jgi:hypothetical protein